jgi:signal transduction histidine kinase
MRLFRSPRALSLGMKLIVIIIMIAVVLAGTMIVLLRNSTRNLAVEIGDQRLQTEIGIVQTQIQQHADLLRADAQLIARENELGNAIARGDSSTVNAIINRAVRDFRLDELDVVDQYAQRIVNMGEEASGDKDEYIVRALAGEALVGIIDNADEGNGDVLRLSLAAAIPIYNVRGITVGAIFISRAIEDEFLAELALGRDQVHLGLMYDHQILARFMQHQDHQDSDMSMQPESTTNTGEMGTTSNNALPVTNELAPGIPVDPDSFDRALRDDMVVAKGLVFSQDGQPHAQAYIPVLNADGIPGAVMLIQVQLATIFDFQSAIVQETGLFIAIVSIIGAIFVAFGVRRFVVRPVKDLQQTAEWMSEGNYRVRAHVYSSDELGRLAHSFNEMVETIMQRDLELKEVNASLEARVEERTEELWRAVHEAKEANRLKDEFLAVMSHELRTPLNAMIGYLGIIKMTVTLDETTEERIDRVRANSERLLHLINDILDISRIESGRMQFVPSPLPLREVIDEIRSQMEVLAKEKNVEFIVEVDPELPSIVQMDEDAMYKILINLLGNAFKFTEKGFVSLNVLKRGDEWELRVQDTGIGIPAHMHNVIFDRFRQVDGSTKRNYGGTGLGLAIVKQICVAIDGGVRVESEPNKGSTFIVTMPLQQGELEPELEGV